MWHPLSPQKTIEFMIHLEHPMRSFVMEHFVDKVRIHRGVAPGNLGRKYSTGTMRSMLVNIQSKILDEVGRQCKLDPGEPGDRPRGRTLDRAKGSELITLFVSK